MDYQDILESREKRAQTIRRCMRSIRETHVEVTLNIPGRTKDSRLYRAVHMEMLTRLIPALDAYLSFLEYLPSGPFALLHTEMAPERVKTLAVQMEEETPIGRVFDIDVFYPDGRKISRDGRLRHCYICDEAAAVCARRESHTYEELKCNILQRIQSSPAFRQIFSLAKTLPGGCYHAVPCTLDSDRASLIGRLAQRALVEEVALTVKPGLVDAYDNGSHSDMDIQTFLSSATALGPTFHRLAKAGMEYEGNDPALLFPELRNIGLEGERSMFLATGGVNTHKGMIFSCGLITAAAGLCSRIDELPRTIARICSSLVSDDLGNLRVANTYGERLYQTSGNSGVRGEAEQGFPAVFRAYSRYRVLRERHDSRTSLLQLLIEIMSTLDDTNILGRGGESALAWVHLQCRDYLNGGGVIGDRDLKGLYGLNETFKERNLSPGGAADTLGCVIFLDLLETQGVLS